MHLTAPTLFDVARSWTDAIFQRLIRRNEIGSVLSFANASSGKSALETVTYVYSFTRPIVKSPVRLFSHFIHNFTRADLFPFSIFNYSPPASGSDWRIGTFCRPIQPSADIMEEFTVQFLRERSTIFGQNEIPALFEMPAFLATSDKLPALPALARHAAKPILESRKVKNTFVFKMFSFSGGFGAAAPGCSEIALGGI